MKKLFAIVLCALMLLSVSALAAEPYDYMHVSGCEKWISLREKPSDGSKRLAKIPLGALVTYLDDAGDEFFNIQYAGMRGYALKSYLVDGYNVERYDVPMYVVNCEEKIDLLSEPEEGADVVAEIPLGEDVICRHAIVASEEMALVSYMDKEGYVYLKNLSFLTEWDEGLIRSATVILPGKNGRLVKQTVRDDFALAELSAMIGKAVPGVECQGPSGAQLVIVINDGTTEGRLLRFTMALDGCPILVGENLKVYEFSAKEGKRFWKIFDEAWAGNYLLFE